jgi:formylglycine-generating enzyme required for sulfatase activity
LEDGALSDPGPSDPDVFLSYAREDEARARELATALEREGFAVFWDREVPPGETWHSYIGTALAGARCVVVAWSRHSVASQWVIEEANEGKDRDALVPVLFDSVRPPFGFRAVQAASLVDWRPGRPSPAFDALLRAVHRIIGGRPGSGAEPAIPNQPSPEPARQPARQRTDRRSYRTLAVMAAGVIAVAGAAGAGLYWWQTQPARVGAAAGSGQVAEAGPSTPELARSKVAGETTPVPSATPPVTTPAPSVMSPATTPAPSATSPATTPAPSATSPATTPVPSATSPAKVVGETTPVAKSATLPPAVTRTSIDEIRDCEQCPVMVTVPAGEFTMGSPTMEAGRDDDEGPQRRVTIAHTFAVGKYEVTFAQWDACVAAGGCSRKPEDRGWGRGDRPVINVSWNDTQEYVNWLSKKTGKAYRLPTEAEWEYVARAKSTTAYWWGNEVGRGNANCNGCGGQWEGKQTAPVGRFAANRFGLYDTAGNVWEWVQDCYHGTYDGAPKDGSAWEDGADCPRVLRGGSWYVEPRNVRSAYRSELGPVNRYDLYGFRVARAPD